jgi:hypothetical protein
MLGFEYEFDEDTLVKNRDWLRRGVRGRPAAQQP